MIFSALNAARKQQMFKLKRTYQQNPQRILYRIALEQNFLIQSNTGKAASQKPVVSSDAPIMSV